MGVVNIITRTTNDEASWTRLLKVLRSSASFSFYDLVAVSYLVVI